MRLSKNIFLLFVLIASFGYGQQQKIKYADIVQGELENGMHYYIMHNEEPENRASFYFAQNVGSILENDTQQGLAHFLEHMAFNGSDNFQDKGMLEYLEKNGIKFGSEINAFTSFDETVYNINQVPVQNQKLIDSVLLVLHDWSGYLSLTDKEIDNERGVINEEWRSRNTPNYRASSKIWLEGYLKGSKYENRMAIGKMDIVNNFKYDTLRAYYKRWYRPDQQAVVIVGDVDPEEMEKKVKSVFSEIPLREDLPKRPKFDVPLNKDFIYLKATDKELGEPTVSYFIKRNTEELSVLEKEKQGLINGYANYILNNRLSELMVSEDSPVLNASLGIQEFVRPLEVLTLNIVPKKDSLLAALDFTLTEYNRFAKYGATEAELERTKAAFKTSFESSKKNINKRSNDSYASEIYSAFFSGEQITDYKWTLDYDISIVDKITNQDIIDYLSKYQGEIGRGVAFKGSSEHSYPNKSEVLSLVEEVTNKKLKPYSEKVFDKKLVEEDLKGARVVSKEKIKGIDGNLYTLSNGIKLAFYKTDFEKDKLYAQGFSPGGQSLITTENLPNVLVAPYLVSQSGLGSLNKIELQKLLAGKDVSVNTSINQFSEDVSGMSSTEDAEIMLQEIYLYFTAPRFDKNAFNILKQNLESNLIAKKNNVQSVFQDSLSLASTNYSDRTLIFDQSLIDSIKFDKISKIYTTRISNASDFTFVFIGDFNEENLLKLARKYLGSIPKGKKESIVDRHMRPKKGITKVHISEDMQTPQATVSISYNGEIEYSAKNNMATYMIGELLNKRYMETIREEEGGSYGVSVGGNISRKPISNFNLNVSFNCNPDKKDKLIGIVYEEIENIMNDIDEVQLQKVKNNIKKNRKEALKDNNFWLSQIVSSLDKGEPVRTQKSFEKLVDGITVEDIQEIAKKINAEPAIVEGVLSPKVSQKK
ncbi:M16 family metallopeptidase [Zunongwangia sp.]|uniref:M16 family metallopeptidase n=1 Tax=Zunongwangia sp. TaxID=1965325 RepID=UPI003AA89246